eukprot:EG_transcript_20756
MGVLLSNLVFLPPPPTYDRSLRDLIFINGRLPALFLELPPRSDGSGLPYTLLFSHGNAEDLGQIGAWLQMIREHCQVQVLAYEYPGYGVHPGPPSEARLYDTIREAYDFLRWQKQIPASRIVLFGRSLGSGPTVHLAALLGPGPTPAAPPSSAPAVFACHCCSSDPGPPPAPSDAGPGGVILQSPLTSAYGVVSQTCAAFLPGDVFVNVAKIDRVLCPVLVIHGTCDVVVPFDHGKTLSSKAPHLWKFLPVEGAGHNNLEECHASRFLFTVTEFIGYLGASARKSPSPSDGHWTAGASATSQPRANPASPATTK